MCTISQWLKGTVIWTQNNDYMQRYLLREWEIHIRCNHKIYLRIMMFQWAEQIYMYFTTYRICRNSSPGLFIFSNKKFEGLLFRKIQYVSFEDEKYLTNVLGDYLTGPSHRGLFWWTSLWHCLTAMLKLYHWASKLFSSSIFGRSRLQMALSSKTCITT